MKFRISTEKDLPKQPKFQAENAVEEARVDMEGEWEREEGR